MVDDLALAVARGAGALGLHLTEDRPLDLDDTPGAVAALAGAQLPSLGGAGAVAVLAGGEARVGDRLGAARGRLLERDREADAHVAPARALRLAAGAAAAHAAEERVEDVPEAKAPAAEDVGDVDVVGPEPGGAVRVSVAVVVGPLPVVREHGVGLVDLLEALLGVGRVAHVRMKRSRLLEEGSLDRLCVGVARHLEHLVVVPLWFHVPLSPQTCVTHGRARHRGRVARSGRSPSSGAWCTRTSSPGTAR